MSLYAQEISVTDFRAQLMAEFGLDESNQNEGTSVEAITSYIDDANREFIEHKAWSFRLKHFAFLKKSSKKVKTTFNTSAVSIELNDTSDLPSTGKIYISGNIITYTANNTVDGILAVTTSTIQVDHLAGEDVLFLHPLPADYCKMSSLWVNGKKYFPQDLNENITPAFGRFFEITENEANGVVKRYFLFPIDSNTFPAVLKYGSLAENLIIDPETKYIEVPAPHRDFIKESVFARIYKHLEEFEQMKISGLVAENLLKKAAVFDSKKHFSNKMIFRSAWDNPKSILYNRVNYKQ